MAFDFWSTRGYEGRCASASRRRVSGRGRRRLLGILAVPLGLTTAPPGTDAVSNGPLWEDATDAAIGVTTAWSNKVDLADVDGDGDVDILVADGGDYESPGDPVVSQIWLATSVGDRAGMGPEAVTAGRAASAGVEQDDVACQRS